MKGNLTLAGKIVSRSVEFVNKQGIPLSGTIEMPTDGKVRYSAIFAHCFTCSKNYKGVVYISKYLAGMNVLVLRFDFTGLGQSQGDFGRTTFLNNISDLFSAADFLKNEFSAPSLLIGHSLGGAAVIKAVHQIPYVKAICTIASPFDLKHLHSRLGNAAEEAVLKGRAKVNIGGRQFELSGEFFQELLNVNLQSFITTGRPHLILHSPDDKIVDFEQGLRFIEGSSGEKSFISLPGVDHLLSKEADADYVAKLIYYWADKYIT